MSVAKLERNQELVRRRVAGESCQQLARRFRMSAQACSVIARREATQAVDRLELELLLDLKRDTVTAFVVPAEPAEDRHLALGWLTYCLRKLAERGVEAAVKVHTAENGVVFELCDVTDYTGRSKP